ncbi:MAG: hypothetical protein IPH82_29215 [Chloroflexi bacterium]|nr:hypothetical protein [Chloroflexota bacterium]
MSLMAQSQALVNVRAPDNQAIAQARLMAVAAIQIDSESTGGQNNALLAPWNYHLTRAFTAPYQPLTTLIDHTGVIPRVAWNNDGSLLASASYDSIIWDTASWQPQTVLTNHVPGIGYGNLTWNSDGSRLASTSYNNTIVIWDTGTWQPLIVLPNTQIQLQT